ncbi:olfactory receptor 12D1-like [Tiliqua scincoides]|uniref:olfactory receptor 12D1-like n=1 Tax=Tiliqua scincoides TaxID=71010 RepID=UPI0034630E36
MENQTVVQEFILLGLTNDQELQHVLFTPFLLLYMACLLGNGAILTVVVAEPKLHMPMYFFLGNLSCLDICYTTATMPKMLSGFLLEHQAISFSGCLTQLHFFHFLGSSEAMLLGVMAYDRYVAICKPLRYSTIMSKQACLRLAVATWTAGFFYALMNTVLTSRLWFCGPNHILHFICDIKPLLKLACSSTALNLMSRWKAFSTCASHLTVVALFYIPVISNYALASAGDSAEREMTITVLYSAVTPVLNPLIYSMRNQEVKSCLRKALSRKLLSERA